MLIRLLLRSVLRGRCPCCGEGAIFDGVLRLRESCARCELVYEQWEGEWITPTYIASSLGLLVGLGWMLGILVRDPRAATFDAELSVAAVAMAVALFSLRPAKAGWLAFLYWVGAVEVSARTRALLRWDDRRALAPAERGRVRAADARARTIRTPADPVRITRRFVSLRSLLFPRVGPPPKEPPGAPGRRLPGAGG